MKGHYLSYGICISNSIYLASPTHKLCDLRIVNYLKGQEEEGWLSFNLTNMWSQEGSLGSIVEF